MSITPHPKTPDQTTMQQLQPSPSTGQCTWQAQTQQVRTELQSSPATNVTSWPQWITPMISPPASQPAPSTLTQVLQHTPASIPNARSLGQLHCQSCRWEEMAQAQQATELRHPNPEVQLPTPPATQAATAGMLHCFLLMLYKLTTVLFSWPRLCRGYALLL